jgi:ligand-binding sensor domain-containing protein
MRETCAEGVGTMFLNARYRLMLAAGLLAASTMAVAQGSEKVADRFETGNNTYVRSLLHDKAGSSLWVGTSVGVMEIDLKTVAPRRTFTRNDGLANEYVFAMGIDSQGYNWFGTNAGGASRYKNGKWKTYFPMHGLADYWIYSFANDKNGNLWIGTWAGANKYSMSKLGSSPPMSRNLINEWVYGLGVDPEGRVYGSERRVASPCTMESNGNRGRTRMDLALTIRKRSRRVPIPGWERDHGTTLQPKCRGRASYNPNYVFSILIAKDGSVWAGTWGGGVSRWDGKKWTSLSSRDGLAGNIVYSMAQDELGVFWFGTNKGCPDYDGKTWRTIGSKDGLLDENVYAMAVTPGAQSSGPAPSAA